MRILAHLLSKTRGLTTESAGAATHRTLLLLLCLAVFVPPLFRGFIDPDETRYAEIIREMVESGDWMVPHLNYVPFVLKPPLLYWFGAGFVKLLGFHPWVLRLAPLFAAILGVLATYELGAAVASRRTGLMAAAILATSAEYVILAVSLVMDMVFSALLFGAWWTFWQHYATGGRTRFYVALFWLFMALACLTKGPLGGALVIAVTLVFLALRGEWSFASKLRPVMGLAIVAAVNLPWVICLYLHDPRLVSFLYWRVNRSGLYGAVLQREKPFYFYLGAIPEGILPWSLPAIAAIILAAAELVRKGRKTAPAGLVWILCIFAGVFLVLSISAAKMETYCLPLFPAIAILTARYIDQSENRALWERLLVPVQWLAVAAGVTAFAAFGAVQTHFALSLRNPVIRVLAVLAIVALAGLVLASVAWLRGRFKAAMLIMGATAGVVFPLALIQVPRLATWRTTRPLCESFRHKLAADDLVVLADPNAYSVPLFLERRVALVGRAAEMGLGLFVETQPRDLPIPVAPFRVKPEKIHSEYLLGTDDLERLWTSGRLVYLFADDHLLQELKHRGMRFWSLGDNGHLFLVVSNVRSSHFSGVDPPSSPLKWELRTDFRRGLLQNSEWRRLLACETRRMGEEPHAWRVN
jgi:4-amino-4-deoxy-L-arabinose transferase-like glycosyltransferase